MLKPLHTTYDANKYTNIVLYNGNEPQLWDTAELFKQIANYDKTHPISGTELRSSELDYIGKIYSFMNIIKNTNHDPQEIYKNFILNDGFLNVSEMAIARAYLNPTHFADHFKQYYQIPDIDRYERLQAIRQLSTGGLGDWVLRYSSLNHPADEKHLQLIEKLMLEYYVISFNTLYGNKRVTSHLLILHQPGRGWAQITDVVYGDDCIYPVPPKRSKLVYYPCFVDLVLALMRKYNFSLSCHIPAYFEL